MVAQSELRFSEFDHEGYRVELIPHTSSAWTTCERDLSQLGVPIPLPHRLAWARAVPSANYLFVAVRDGAGKCCYGFGLHVSRTRALPGHLVLRVERFGASATVEARQAGILALLELAKENWRVLRLHVEVFSVSTNTRTSIGRDLSEHGFRLASRSRCYSRTVGLDLAPTEQEIFASFNKKVRRDIRAVEKNPVKIRPILEYSLVDRLELLMKETLQRTGGSYHYQNWQSIINLSKEQPHLSRLVGLFRVDVSGADSLLAFAWGCGHGDHCQYSIAASTRRTDLRMPLAYGLVWDLICWAKREGAGWFDFGGITAGTVHGQDPLGGISDFKRYFSTELIDVGAEWILEPRRYRAFLARIISGAARFRHRPF